MGLKDWVEKIEESPFLLKICRESCPVAQVSGVETYTPHSILQIIYLLITDQLEWSQTNVEPIYMCQLCNRCNYSCNGFPFTDIIMEARNEIMEKGLIPDSIGRAKEKIKRTINGWKKTAIESLKNISKNKSETILIAGEGYWRHSNLISKAINILDKIIGEIAFDLEREYDTGSYLAFLGVKKELKEKAEKIKEKLENYNEIIVLDPLSYYVIKQIYPKLGIKINSNIKHYIEVLKENVEMIKLEKDSEVLVYTHPYELNLANLQDTALDLLHKLGVDIKNPQYSRKRTYPTGSAGFFNFIDEKLAKQITQEKILMVLESTNMREMLTISPWEYSDMKSHSNNYNIKVYDLIEIVVTHREYKT